MLLNMYSSYHAVKQLYFQKEVVQWGGLPDNYINNYDSRNGDNNDNVDSYNDTDNNENDVVTIVLALEKSCQL